jgi:hypothetical protein
MVSEYDTGYFSTRERVTARIEMLDDKQQALIQSWIQFGQEETTNAYNRFIALWIALNAYCCAQYATAAHRDQASIKARGYDGLTGEQQPVKGTIQRADARVTIDLAAPSEIRIVIKERYTENFIFHAFAEQYAKAYQALLQTESFHDQVAGLQHALEKRPGEYYVINMAKAAQHDPMRHLHELQGQNIIVRFTDTTSLRQLKDVLYQIRCNVFHGEKVPGEPNDDRIVTAAIPVLQAILAIVMAQEMNERQHGLQNVT